MNEAKQYRKKPVVIAAKQWFRDGDHPEVMGMPLFARPVPDIECNACSVSMLAHGWVGFVNTGHIVCPGDWIITGVKGEHYPCKPDIFEATYEKVE